MKNILDSSRYANGATSAHANVSEENFSESWSYVTATFPFWVEEEDSRFVRHSLTRFTFWWVYTCKRPAWFYTVSRDEQKRRDSEVLSLVSRTFQWFSFKTSCECNEQKPPRERTLGKCLPPLRVRQRETLFTLQRRNQARWRLLASTLTGAFPVRSDVIVRPSVRRMSSSCYVLNIQIVFRLLLNCAALITTFLFVFFVIPHFGAAQWRAVALSVDF